MVKLAPHELEAQANVMAGHPLWLVRSPEEIEQAAVEQFARVVTALGSVLDAPQKRRERVLAEVAEVARAIDLSQCPGSDRGYGRRVLWEDEETGWSIAAITLRYGQMTEAHDHNGWGCAVTVQGIERDRRFAIDAAGDLELISTRDYPAGTGYLFDMADIHQPVGADRTQDTIALHVLFPDHAAGTAHQHRHEQRDEAVAA